MAQVIEIREEQEQAKRGRPCTFDQAIADEICARLAMGESLRAICRDEHIPSINTVKGWVIDDRSGFAVQYARARELLVEHWADEIVELADEDCPDNTAVQRNRLRVDTRKWIMSKVAPKKYGDRIEHVLKPARVEDMTDEELARIAGTALLITSTVSDAQDETPPEYPGNKGGGGVADG